MGNNTVNDGSNEAANVAAAQAAFYAQQAQYQQQVQAFGDRLDNESRAVIVAVRDRAAALGKQMLCQLRPKGGPGAVSLNASDYEYVCDGSGVAFPFGTSADTILAAIAGSISGQIDQQYRGAIENSMASFAAGTDIASGYGQTIWGGIEGTWNAAPDSVKAKWRAEGFTLDALYARAQASAARFRPTAIATIATPPATTPAPAPLTALDARQQADAVVESDYAHGYAQRIMQMPPVPAVNGKGSTGSGSGGFDLSGLMDAKVNLFGMELPVVLLGAGAVVLVLMSGRK
jgi:hypothetical protein